MAETKTEQIINESKGEILDLINKTFAEVTHLKFEYKTGWSSFEKIIQECLFKFLSEKFPKAKVVIPEGKNDYPDISLITDEGSFAIDIKTSEGSKAPEFDMARIDTMDKEHIEPFEEEWEIVIKYDKKSGKLLNVYFNLFREIVGKHKYSGGIKYRLYDGKVRPKSWNDMENNKIYWNTQDEYLKAIRTSFEYRWTSLISKYLAPNLSEAERPKYIKLFDSPVDLPEEIEEENGESEE